MFFLSPRRHARRLSAPGLLAVALALFVGLTVAGPASAASATTLTVTATTTGDESNGDGGLAITATGSGGPNDYLYIYVNDAGHPCAATPRAEMDFIDSTEQPYPSTASASGSFSVKMTASYRDRPGLRTVCGYVGSLYAVNAAAQSNALAAYTCPTDKSFTISDVQIATGKQAGEGGGHEIYWGAVSLLVHHPANTSADDEVNLTPQGDSDPKDLSIATLVSKQVDKGEIVNVHLSKTGGTVTYTIDYYPMTGPHACVQPDGTVLAMGPATAFHAPSQTLKVTYGAACEGGTALLDGQPLSVTNVSATHPYNKSEHACAAGSSSNGGSAAGKTTKPAVKGAKSGKCTSKTKLAAGYACRRGRVVKK